MKKSLTKILSMTLVFLMVLCLVPPVEATAASKPIFPTKEELLYYPKANSVWNETPYSLMDSNYIAIKGWKITNVKSNNTKVLTAKAGKGYAGVDVIAKKAGKAKITFKATKGKESYSYSCTITVVKYTNPFKTIKIGKQNYASKFKQVDYYNLNSKKAVKGKLNIAAAKGWKLKSIQLYDSKKDIAKTVKNKSTVTITNKKNTLWVTFVNTKTKKEMTAFLDNNKY